MWWRHGNYSNEKNSKGGSIMYKTIVTIALLFIGVAAQAAPNYDYVDVKPGETYTNNSTQTQQIRVRRDYDTNKTKVEKLNNGISTTTNTIYNTLSGVRTITSMFGLY